MTTKDAKEYIEFGIKKGDYTEDQFLGMSEHDLIEFVKREMERGDDEANRNEE